MKNKNVTRVDIKGVLFELDIVVNVQMYFNCQDNHLRIKKIPFGLC